MSESPIPDGIWIRRVNNGWVVYDTVEDSESVVVSVYEDVTVAMGDESAGIDSSAARSLSNLLWCHFDSYMRSKHRAGLVISVQPATSHSSSENEE